MESLERQRKHDKQEITRLVNMLRNDLSKEVTTDALCVAKARFEEPEKLKLRFQKTQTDIWGKNQKIKKKLKRNILK